MKNLTVMLGRTFVAAMFVVATPAWGQTPAKTPAEVAFDKGKEAVEAEKWSDAIVHLSDAYRLDPSARHAAWLGRAQVEAGDFASGAMNLETFLREEVESKSKMRDRVLEKLEIAKEKTASILLDVNQSGVEVFVDDKRIDDKRAQWPIYVLPGEHSFEVKKSGFVPFKFRNRYAAREKVRVPVTLLPQPSIQDKPKEGKPVEVEPSGMSMKAKVGFGLGGGLLAVAIGTGIGAFVTYSAAADTYPVNGKCPNPFPTAACGQPYEDAKSDAKRLMVPLTVTASVTAGLGLAALIYAGTQLGAKEPAKPSAKVGLVVTPMMHGAVVSGTW